MNTATLKAEPNPFSVFGKTKEINKLLLETEEALTVLKDKMGGFLVFPSYLDAAAKMGSIEPKSEIESLLNDTIDKIYDLKSSINWIRENFPA